MAHPLTVTGGASRAPSPDAPSPRPVLTTAGSALATLAVILASVLLSHGGGGGTPLPEDPRLQLTELARRALDDLPLAYQAEDAVVVPVGAAEAVEWPGAVPRGRIANPVLPLGAHGLLPYRRLTDVARAPAWTEALSGSDRVFVNVGPLWLACVSWSRSDRCSPTVLMYHDDTYYAFASHFGPFGNPERGAVLGVVSLNSVDGTRVGQVLVGGTSVDDVDRVGVTLVDGSRQAAWTSRAIGSRRATMWWTTVWRPVESVTAYDRDGDVVAEVSLASD